MLFIVIDRCGDRFTSDAVGWKSNPWFEDKICHWSVGRSARSVILAPVSDVKMSRFLSAAEGKVNGS